MNGSDINEKRIDELDRNIWRTTISNIVNNIEDVDTLKFLASTSHSLLCREVARDGRSCEIACMYNFHQQS